MHEKLENKMLEANDHRGALLLRQIMVTLLPLQRQNITFTSLSLQRQKGKIFNGRFVSLQAVTITSVPLLY
jgi:hypothetical protein